MEEIKEKKNEVIQGINDIIDALSPKEKEEKYNRIEKRLFEFANFMEAKTVLFYMRQGFELDTHPLIQKSIQNKKIVALPVFTTDKYTIKLMRIENLDSDLVIGAKDILEPKATHCKVIPVDQIDIAIIPGLVFDEKGGRMGFGDGYYERLISKLPMTTRKVSIVYEEQILTQTTVESKNKHVDIIISDERIIYKI